MWQLVQDLNGQLSQPPTADESALLRRLIALRERLAAIASAKREHCSCEARAGNLLQTTHTAVQRAPTPTATRTTTMTF